MTMTGSTAGESVNYIFVPSACATNGGTGATASAWQASATYVNPGLQANKCYGWTVQAQSQSTALTNAASTPLYGYTLANTPAAPGFSTWAIDGYVIYNNENGNPSSAPATQFALLVSSPSDATWNNKYVDASGNPSAAAVWLYDGQLDGLTLHNTSQSITYTASVKARNVANTETAFGSSGSSANLAQSLGIPVTGYAGSERIGLIKLYCTSAGTPNDCASHPYGLGVNADASISGYAWSDSVGWISAYSADTSVCTPTSNARIVGTQFKGWLREINVTGDDTGCIKLDPGQAQDVSISGTTITGNAWSGVFGWAQFDATANIGPASCTMNANPSVVWSAVPPSSITLSYTTQSAASASIADDNASYSPTYTPAPTPLGSSTSVPPPTLPSTQSVTTTFLMTVTNYLGAKTTCQSSVVVNHGFPPPQGCISINTNNPSCTPPVVKTISVRKGSSASLYWTVQNVDSCTLTKNGAAEPAITPTQTTPYTTGALAAHTEYVLSCPGKDDNGSTFTDRAVINITPAFQEI
jgi:hypothetical protein